MPVTRTETLKTDSRGYARAVQIWRGGGLVAFPTETVYGLGADATNDRAVAAVYAAKGRPAFNPLIIHVADLGVARRFAVFDARAELLAGAFWPGPLSLVLPVRPEAGLSGLVTAGLDSVAVRVPAHPVAQALLAAFGGAIAAPSANPSGRMSPTSAAHVFAGLSGRIDAVLDGGDCAVGVESTIVSTIPDVPLLLRPGGLPREVLEHALGEKLRTHANPEAPNAPGQLTSHYAPNAPLRLNVTQPAPGEIWLGFGQQCPDATRNLSPGADLVESAANLFRLLHELDALSQAQGGAPIAVAPIPETGLGLAINDRLRRAAAPRD